MRDTSWLDNAPDAVAVNTPKRDTSWLDNAPDAPSNVVSSPKPSFTGKSLVSAIPEALNSATLGASDYITGAPGFAIAKLHGYKGGIQDYVKDLRHEREMSFRNDLGQTGGGLAQAGINAVGSLAPALVTGGESLVAKAIADTPVAPVVKALAGGVDYAKSTGGGLIDGLVNGVKTLAPGATVGGMQGALNAKPDEMTSGAVSGAIGGAFGSMAGTLSDKLRPLLAKKMAGGRLTDEEFMQVANMPLAIKEAPELFNAQKGDYQKSIVGQAREIESKLGRQAGEGSKQAIDVLKNSGVSIPLDQAIGILDKAKELGPKVKSPQQKQYFNAIESIKKDIQSQAGASKQIPLEDLKYHIQSLGDLAKNAFNERLPTFNADAGTAFKNARAGLNEALKLSAPGEYKAIMEGTPSIPGVAPITAALEPLRGPLKNDTQLVNALKAVKQGRALNNSLQDADVGQNFLTELDRVSGGNLSQQLERRALLDKLKGRDASEIGSTGENFGAHIGENVGELASHAIPGGRALFGGLGSLYGKTKSTAGGTVALKLLNDQANLNAWMQANPNYAQAIKSAMQRGGASVATTLSAIINQDQKARESALGVIK